MTAQCIRQPETIQAESTRRSLTNTSHHSYKHVNLAALQEDLGVTPSVRVTHEYYLRCLSPDLSLHLVLVTS